MLGWCAATYVSTDPTGPLSRSESLDGLSIASSGMAFSHAPESVRSHSPGFGISTSGSSIWLLSRYVANHSIGQRQYSYLEFRDGASDAGSRSASGRAHTPNVMACSSGVEAAANPYGSLEDIDSLSSPTGNRPAPKYSFKRRTDYVSDDDDSDPASSRAVRYKNLRLGTVKKGDTRIAGGGALVSAAPTPRRLPKLFRGRGGPGVDPGAASGGVGWPEISRAPSAGYRFQKMSVQDSGPRGTWNALDAVTGDIISGVCRVNALEPPNPWDDANLPLGMTFGTPGVSYSADAAESGDAGDLSGGEGMFVRQRHVKRTPHVDECGLVSAMSADIHEDVACNFITNVRDIHDAAVPLTKFEELNKDWLACDMSSPSIKEFRMNIGPGNIVAYHRRAEDRTRHLNSQGAYDGNNLGEVKKRFRFGFLDLLDEWESELLHADSVFRFWSGLPLKKRIEVLEMVRRPVVLFEGRTVPAEGDVLTVPLPAIYQSWSKERKVEELRKRSLRVASVSDELSAGSVRSKRSTSSRDSRGTVGTLGDLDRVYNFDNEVIDPSSLDERDKNRIANVVRRRLGGAVGGVVADAMSGTASSLGFGLGASGSGSVVGSFSVPGRSPRFGGSMRMPPSHGSQRAGSARSGNVVAASTVTNIATSGFDLPVESVRGASSVGSPGRLGEILEFDDSILAQDPCDYGGPPVDLTADLRSCFDLVVKNDGLRGRLVVVKLDRLVKFTPGAVARRMFGGLIQEFQLHPSRSAAVVVFVHPAEARSFLQHVQNVWRFGTAQEQSQLQMEAWWYRYVHSCSLWSG